MTKKPKRCSENEAYANPEDRVDRLGRVFATLKLHERYGVTFERWIDCIQQHRCTPEIGDVESGGR